MSRKFTIGDSDEGTWAGTDGSVRIWSCVWAGVLKSTGNKEKNVNKNITLHKLLILTKLLFSTPP